MVGDTARVLFQHSHPHRYVEPIQNMLGGWGDEFGQCPDLFAAIRQEGAFLSLAKTCDKLGIALWDYLGSRFKVAGHTIIQPLDHYVRAQFRPA